LVQLAVDDSNRKLAEIVAAMKRTTFRDKPLPLAAQPSR
jgi:hypothetical protein